MQKLRAQVLQSPLNLRTKALNYFSTTSSPFTWRARIGWTSRRTIQTHYCHSQWNLAQVDSQQIVYYFKVPKSVDVNKSICILSECYTISIVSHNNILIGAIFYKKYMSWTYFSGLYYSNSKSSILNFYLQVLFFLLLETTFNYINK